MNHGEMNGDKRHMHMEWRNHMLMRVLIGLIVLIFTFWCGMQLGEIRGTLGLEHGGLMMNRGWNGNAVYTTSGSAGTVQMHTMIPAGTTTITPATGAAAQ